MVYGSAHVDAAAVVVVIDVVGADGLAAGAVADAEIVAVADVAAAAVADEHGCPYVFARRRCG